MRSQMKRALAIFMALAVCANVQAGTESSELLVKVSSTATIKTLAHIHSLGTTENIGLGWIRVHPSQSLQASKLSLNALRQSGEVTHVQPNYRIALMHDFKVRDLELRKEIERLAKENPNETTAPKDNPAIPAAPADVSGPDPLLGSQWGMMDIGVRDIVRSGGKEVVVAVIDTGVDYTHEDLVSSMWRNPGEMPDDGVDNDGNGFIDDIVGWDFVSNDNLPYDLSVNWWDLLLGGGNPGHGTHCAGNVGARTGNSKGITGVASNVKIMALRFLSEKGQGTTADAVKAIRYAVANLSLIHI